MSPRLHGRLREQFCLLKFFTSKLSPQDEGFNRGFTVELSGYLLF